MPHLSGLKQPNSHEFGYAGKAAPTSVAEFVRIRPFQANQLRHFDQALPVMMLKSQIVFFILLFRKGE